MTHSTLAEELMVTSGTGCYAEAQLVSLARLRSELLEVLTEGEEDSLDSLAKLEQLIAQHGTELGHLLAWLDGRGSEGRSVQQQFDQARSEMERIEALLQARLRLTATQLRRTNELRRALSGYAQRTPQRSEPLEAGSLLA